MDTVKNVAIFLAIGLAVLANVRLYNEKTGFLIYSQENADKWYQTCHYYTPFHFFTTQIRAHYECARFAPNQ